MGHSRRFFGNTLVISVYYKNYFKKQSLPIMGNFRPGAKRSAKPGRWGYVAQLPSCREKPASWIMYFLLFRPRRKALQPLKFKSL